MSKPALRIIESFFEIFQCSCHDAAHFLTGLALTVRSCQAPARDWLQLLTDGAARSSARAPPLVFFRKFAYLRYASLLFWKFLAFRSTVFDYYVKIPFRFFPLGHSNFPSSFYEFICSVPKFTFSHRPSAGLYIGFIIPTSQYKFCAN